jgi:hypothetical protein
MRHSSALIILFLFAIAGVAQARAQANNLVALKAAVRTCVRNVREQAERPENFQFGQPPMWKNFDAYVSPDGLIHNNVLYVSQMDGVYRFDKCMAEQGFSLMNPKSH